MNLIGILLNVQADHSVDPNVVETIYLFNC